MARPVRKTLALLGALLAIPGDAAADRLTLYAIPSPRVIRWDSPRQLLMSQLWNRLTPRKPYRRSLGHVAVEITSDDGKTMKYLSGMTDAGFPFKQKVLKEKQGLGVLLQSVPGELEKSDELRPEILARKASGELGYLTFALNEKTSARVLRYLKEYDARDYEKMYGLPNRPRFGEGAGCSAFGVSCLAVAGVLSPEMDRAWSKSVRVPASLVGGAGGKKVSVRDLIFSRAAGHWARAGEPSRPVRFYDPGTMYRWIVDEWTRVSRSGKPTGGVRAERQGLAKGLFVDATKLPTPTEPLWLHEQQSRR